MDLFTIIQPHNFIFFHFWTFSKTLRWFFYIMYDTLQKKKKKEDNLCALPIYPYFNESRHNLSLKLESLGTTKTLSTQKVYIINLTDIIYQIRIFERFMLPQPYVNSTSRFVSTIIGKVTSIISKIRRSIYQ